VGTDKRLRRLGKPSSETLEAIAAVLGEHWRAATPHPEQLFWAASVSWLTVHDVRPRAPRAPDHHLTSGGKLIR
jgi:hypothetical protein